MATFRKRSNKWEYRVRYYDTNGKQLEKSKGGFPTKKEAQLAAAQIELQIENNTFVSDSNVLFKDYILEWLEVYKKPHVKVTTYLRLERTIRNLLIPAFGHMKLIKINRAIFQKWINQIAPKYKTDTIRSYIATMSDAFDTAVNDLNLMERNPATKIKIPPKEEDSFKKIKFFERDELERFLQYIKDNPPPKYKNSIQYYALFTLFARTGLRMGEAFALTWDDIDFENLTISITKGVAFKNNNEVIVQTPKTKSSIRTLLVDRDTLKLLKKHKIKQYELSLKFPKFQRPDVNLVFHSSSGDYLRPTTTREYMKQKCKEAHVAELSPHALRHTHAVQLLESGANIKFVSERLGHATINMTANTYLHISQKIEEDAISNYQKYLENGAK